MRSERDIAEPSVSYKGRKRPAVSNLQTTGNHATAGNHERRSGFRSTLYCQIRPV